MITSACEWHWMVRQLFYKSNKFKLGYQQLTMWIVPRFGSAVKCGETGVAPGAQLGAEPGKKIFL